MLDKSIPIFSDVFFSVQGEGPYAGIPTIFIRFQGCTVGCRFCDEKKSWSFAIGGKKSYSDILALADESGIHHFTITGGEPLENPSLLSALTDALSQQYADAEFHLETSGANWVTNSKEVLQVFSSIVLSPKLLYVTDGAKWYFSKLFLTYWHEHIKVLALKFVVGHPTDFDEAVRFVDEFIRSCKVVHPLPVIFSPMFDPKEPRLAHPDTMPEILRKFSLTRIPGADLRMGLQMHKIWNCK